MQFCKLIDEKGAQIPDPTPQVGSVSFDVKDGRAYAWAEDGKTMLAELHAARVLWIGAAGVRLEGHEPIESHGLRFRLMQWQLIF